jgi:ATP-dependent RNA helicase DHX57
VIFTGCGKTTQRTYDRGVNLICSLIGSFHTVPQFILDSLIKSNQGAKASIIVTQPRRVAATSVAARVSAERLDDGSVGFAIRGESKQTNKTKLLFCTTGVVLRRLGMGDALQDVTHVIVDEAGSSSALIWTCLMRPNAGS